MSSSFWKLQGGFSMRKAMVVWVLAAALVPGISVVLAQSEPAKPMPADAKPKFDVVTVKPSDPNASGTWVAARGRHVQTGNTTVSTLIMFAYGIQKRQIAGGPAWLEERYDIDGVPNVEGQPSNEQMRMLIQDALSQ